MNTKKQTLHSLKVVDNLINNYLENNGDILEITEGTLGHGTTICIAFGKKTAVIQEVFLNSWSSAHTITLYNKLPKKYILMINEYYKNN
jgi:hypothetical protein